MRKQPQMLKFCFMYVNIATFLSEIMVIETDREILSEINATAIIIKMEYLPDGYLCFYWGRYYPVKGCASEHIMSCRVIFFMRFYAIYSCS